MGLVEFCEELASDPARVRALGGRPNRVELRARFEEIRHLPWSAVRFARHLGVSDRTIVRWRAQDGISRRLPARRYTPEDREMARRLADERCPIAEIARTVGCDESTIRRWLPDYPGISPVEAGRLARAIRRFELGDAA